MTLSEGDDGWVGAIGKKGMTVQINVRPYSRCAQPARKEQLREVEVEVGTKHLRILIVVASQVKRRNVA